MGLLAALASLLHDALSHHRMVLNAAKYLSKQNVLFTFV